MAGGTEIRIDGRFVKWKGLCLARAHVCEADETTGRVLMASGHQYDLPPEVVKAWFSDMLDYGSVFGKNLLAKAYGNGKEKND